MLLSFYYVTKKKIILNYHLTLNYVDKETFISWFIFFRIFTIESLYALWQQRITTNTSRLCTSLNRYEILSHSSSLAQYYWDITRNPVPHFSDTYYAHWLSERGGGHTAMAPPLFKEKINKYFYETRIIGKFRFFSKCTYFLFFLCKRGGAMAPWPPSLGTLLIIPDHTWVTSSNTHYEMQVLNFPISL